MSFADEEGTFLATLGSTAFCGELTGEAVQAARDAAGRALPEALAAAGYAGRPPARLDRDRHVGFLELHIEQGPRLEAAGVRIGVVTGIAGMRRRVVAFTGRADHAGTTPMGRRRDAGAALVRHAAAVGDVIAAHGGPDTVWNIGRIALEPGASNVVPGRAELLLEHRDLDDAVMDGVNAALEALEAQTAAATGIGVQGTTVAARRGAATDARLAGLLEAAAAEHGASSVRMPSGAGHDARVLGRHVPAAMLFVPSIGGRSHDVAEDTAEDDLVLGVQVLATAVGALLDQA
ncbi:hydantoinase/carbamoylase family amidase [Baekduia soli]|uniref:hydantoinase/carbamoylase family amidase n=1 Tax=Baekduia soli TaxID=496014 RepID=UPI001E42387C|nr:hydantoinase/carbamoylase family amidase [Baekduia soli]